MNLVSLRIRQRKEKRYDGNFLPPPFFDMTENKEQKTFGRFQIPSCFGVKAAVYLSKQVVCP